MTTYAHGVTASEVPTSVRPPITANAALPCFVGAAPVVLGVRTNVNKPVLCTSWAEFVAKLGNGDKDDYSLVRAAYGYFGLYGVSPAVFINVLDPDDAGHVDAVPRALLAWAAGEMTKTVEAAMVARAAAINGCFKALALADLPTDGYDIADYSECASWKSDNSYTNAALICLWPKVKQGDDIYEASIHYAGLCAQTDAAIGDDVPYNSPSNKSAQITGACLDDGTEVFLTILQANILNAAGIVTALNWGGWRLWGNNTAAYPGTSDPKDRWANVKRMNLWLNNTLILTYFSQVDSALNRRLIDSVVDSANIFLNGLKGAGAILGGEVVFAAADNPQTDLLNGHAKFRIYWTPPPPAEALDFIIEYDVANLSKLFA